MPFSSNTCITTLGKAIHNGRLIANTYPLPQFIQIGVGATGAARTAAHTDTALSTAVESRATATCTLQTTDVTNDTYRAVATITATATRAVDEAGIFDLASGGNLTHSATFAAVNLNNADSIQLTWNIKLA